MFEQSMVEKFIKALNASAGVPSEAPQGANLQAVPFMQSLVTEFGFSKAQEVLNTLVGYERLKALGTVDIGALRLVSISDRIAVKRNADTKWLNWLEGRAPANLNDYQYRIIERDILNDTADVVSADRTTLFPEKNSAYNVRYNTLTVIGNTVKASWMAQNIAQQQRGVNILDDLVDDQIVRMRRTENRMLMSNVETVVEGPLNTPQLGGFLTRSTVNAINAGGSNFTNTLLQTGVNTVAEALGDGRELMLFCGEGQIPVISDLMINRFNGESSADFLAFQSSLRGQALAAAGANVEVLYKPRPGAVIPVVFEREMPANSALLFDASLPRMARFKFNGSTGPYILARPEPESAMYDIVAVFDIFTLDDPLQVSRVAYSNLAS